MPPRQLTADEAIEIEADFDDVSQLAGDQKDEESEILQEFGDADGDVRMHFQVRKIMENSKKTAYCFEGTKADLPVMPRIQREFGAGTYKVWIFKNGKLFRNREIVVLTPVAAPIAVPGGASEFSRIADLLERELVQRRAGPTPAPFTLDMQGIAAIITAAGGALAAFKSLMPPPPPPPQQTSIKDTLDLFVVAKELLVPAGNAEPEGFLGLAAKLMNPDTLAALKALAGPPPQDVPQLPSPSQPTPEQIQQAQFAALRRQFDMLIACAQRNAPPDLYADLLADNLPADFLNVLKAPGGIEVMLRIHPPIATYRSWFEAVLRSLAESDMAEQEFSPHGSAASEGNHVPQRGPASFTPANYPQRAGGNARDFEGDGGEGAGGEEGY